MIGANFKVSEIALVVSLMGLVWFSLASNARSASFQMVDGTVVEGDIIDKMAGNAIIRSAIGYAVNSHTSEIGSILFRMQDGTEISGTLVDWREDIYFIRNQGKEAIVEIQRASDRGYLVRAVETARSVPAVSPAAIDPSAPPVSVVDRPPPSSARVPTSTNVTSNKPVM